MGKSLVFEGAPLHMEKKVDFMNRKQEEHAAKAAAQEVIPVLIACSATL
jgi:hypothetical protein